MTSATGLFAREQLAGYDPTVLAKSSAVIVGCGAAGNNVALNLALVGLGEVRFVDFDEVELSNLTRSPLFDRRRALGKRKRHKAREIALGTLAASYAKDPLVRFAVARIEELGSAAFEDASAVIAAVDSLPVRAYLADLTRLIGVPLVEIGFSGTRGQVSVFPNRSAEESCWRCLHPHVEHGGVSCGLYAASVADQGRIPATQPLAALFGSLAAEHVVRAAHGDFPLAGKSLHFDLHGGEARVLEVAADPACPGAHRIFAGIRTLEVGATSQLSELFEAARSVASEPVILLPAPFIVEAPCSACGALVAVGKPSWSVSEPPRCRRCPDIPQLGKMGTVVVSALEPGTELDRRRLKDIGIAAGAIVEIEDASSGRVAPVRVAGSLDEVYQSKRKSNTSARTRMKEYGDTEKENSDGKKRKQDHGDLSPPAGLARVPGGSGAGDDR